MDILLSQQTVTVSLSGRGVLHIVRSVDGNCILECPITMLSVNAANLVGDILGYMPGHLSQIIFEKGWGKRKDNPPSVEKKDE